MIKELNEKLLEFAKAKGLKTLKLDIKKNVDSQTTRGFIAMDVDIRLNKIPAMSFEDKGDGSCETICYYNQEENKEMANLLKEFFEYIKDNKIMTKDFKNNDIELNETNFVPYYLDEMDVIKKSKKNILFKVSSDLYNMRVIKGHSFEDLKTKEMKDYFMNKYFNNDIEVLFFNPIQTEWVNVSKNNYEIINN